MKINQYKPQTNFMFYCKQMEFGLLLFALSQFFRHRSTRYLTQLETLRIDS